MQGQTNQLQERQGVAANAIPAEVLESTQPIVLRGLVSQWPLVQAGLDSHRAAADYIRQFDKGLALTAYEGLAENQGRIFYNDDFTGFNFQRTKRTLADVLDQVISNYESEQSPTVYVGSTMVDHWLPGFRVDNDVDLGSRDSLVSFWLGNKSKIAAHYDFPNNIACSVVGKRKVTLFEPNQAENLYVGPLDFTPSGQPISLVDTTNPDLDRFPKYAQAMRESFTVELHAGDALFIPSMWWHHIEATEPFNVLVNYWWRSTPAFLGSPLNVLHHAIMSFSGLPEEQLKVWKNIFAHYVFDDKAAFDHIPTNARGILGGVDESSAKAIKAQLVKFLK